MDTRYVAMYILTCRHRILEGLYCLPLGYAASDLHWDGPRLLKAWRALLECDFMRYDEHAEVVFIVKALKHQAPDLPNHIKSAVAKLKELPATYLLADLLDAADKHAPKLADHMRHAMADDIEHAIALRMRHEESDGMQDVIVDGMQDGIGDAKGHSPSLSPSLDPPIPPTLAGEADEQGAAGADAPPRRRSGERTRPEPEPCDLEMAELLQGLILQNNPEAKTPDGQLATWANDCRLMRQQDGRDLEDIAAHIRWTQADSFWSGNVLSMAKVRKHWDTHTLRMQSHRGGGSRDSPAPPGVWGRRIGLDGTIAEGGD